jgi:hypothetical protein
VPEPAKQDAALVLQSVKVNGRSAWFSAYTDHLSIVGSDGTRDIPIGQVARISHRTGLRSRLDLVLHDGEVLSIRGLKARDVPKAYRILVRLATTAP